MSIYMFCTCCRYEAIFHCVHFMFREDDLEPPLYIESDTGRMSQSIRYNELRHFFKNGSGDEVSPFSFIPRDNNEFWQTRAMHVT